MSDTINQTQPETSPTPGDNGGAPGKTFTQDEVNRIVSDRLAREREKPAPSPLEAREQALAAREAAMSCREHIAEKGLPVALLDILDTSDAKRFEELTGKLLELTPEIAKGTTPAPPITTAKPHGAPPKPEGDIAKAFGLK